ncbi:MAG TPA: transferrin receptor-like dimerization domain-containing protein [Candidatus Acidoferrum sp.]|nr:transferrin receptor-like dimerization domain-containing protein [Candidatus Acidoferrum sp.]
MNRSILFSAVLLAGASLAPVGHHVIADEQPLAGYSVESSRVERQWEEKLRAIPDPAKVRGYMERLAARPHHVGSPYDKDNAEWLLARFKEFGLDAHIETFDVLFPTPADRLVELVAGGPKFTAKLDEPVVSVDPTSSQKSEQLPTYNAYSIDGDVTGRLVYVNFGVPDDYKQLERMGISVKGAIVIARYYGSWRGIKPKVAAEHGAIGCLIFSDPHEDGYYQGDTFPEGPYRPRDGVQRGSVADMPLYSGDPLTPGVGATKDAKRLELKDAQTITKIPVLPISYGDAQPLLASLTGPMAPAAWRGALGQSYHIGPGPGTVHLRVKSNWMPLKPLYDVIAKIPGSVYPDEWVIRGNHHDGWVNGADDPLSGQSAMLEEARALGELLKQGWKPKRTIIYCAWDGEEPGLLGSTEWVETHADELAKHAVMYVNSDGNGRGYFGLAGSHTLEKFINDVAKDIPDPETKFTAWKRDQLRAIENAPADRKQEIRQRTDLHLGALGSGSDYTPFLQHVGIASLNIGFGGEDGGGIYHSIYDDFYWYTHFADTTFVYGRALAQAGGTAMMRMADADLLPFDFNDFADTMHTYVRELKELSKHMQDEIRETNREIDEGVFAATADPKRPYMVPPKKEEVPAYQNFAPLENAADAVARAAADYRKALEKANANGGAALAAASVADVNRLLIESERKFVTAQGLPNRPWYRHQLYAPGFYTGYAAKTMPAVREAIEQKEWKQADEGIVVVAHCLEDEAALISDAAAKLAAAH